MSIQTINNHLNNLTPKQALIQISIIKLNQSEFSFYEWLFIMRYENNIKKNFLCL
jgi:hypothetical protein